MLSTVATSPVIDGHAVRIERIETLTINFETASSTDIGRKRNSNQDAHRVLVANDSPPGVDVLIAVADGMGGHAAGEVASKMAIDELVTHLSDTLAIAPDQHSTALEEAFRRTNQDIHRAGFQRENRGMGTTLTCAMVVSSTLFIGHVGDSRAYLIRMGEFHRLTQDHTWVTEQVDAGLLSTQAAQSHPMRHVLTQALGTLADVEVQTLQEILKPGDIVLLCSDGLYSLVGDRELADIAEKEQPQNACFQLVELANRRGGHDNITVAVMRYLKVAFDL